MKVKSAIRFRGCLQDKSRFSDPPCFPVSSQRSHRQADQCTGTRNYAEIKVQGRAMTNLKIYFVDFYDNMAYEIIL